MAWTPPPHDPERELRGQLDEAGWRAAVVAVCARHGLDASAPAPFASGSEVVWAAGAAVVKLTAPTWRAELAAEARLLRGLAGRLAVATPELLAHGELAGWPYVVMSRVEGVALGAVWPTLEHRERRRLAADLGALARALHALPVDEVLPPTTGGGEVADAGDRRDAAAWDVFWRACRTDVPARHARRDDPPAALVEQIEPFLAAVGELERGPRVLLHTELLDQHALVTERAGRWELASLIDFADARVGPPGYEFPAPVEFVFRGEPGLLRAFLVAYGLAPDELTPEYAERLLAWALCHRFGRLQRMLDAVAPTRPATLAELAQALYGVGE